jgi:hypothetical protein
MPNLSYQPTPAEHIRIERSTAHACAEAALNIAARFQYGVTDLAVARVFLALEAGTLIQKVSGGRWYAPTGAPVDNAHLSKTVGEMIRTGLAVHHVSGALIPAMVHAKAWLVGSDRWGSACATPGEYMGPKRVRLHANPLMVDCLKCLDRL